MAFLEIQFPTNISFNSSGGPGFSTSIIETDAGIEQRIARWEYPRHRYNAGYGARLLDDLYDVLEFYRAVKGLANGFRFKDWLDYTTASNGRNAHTALDEVLGTGDGAEDEFQLLKRYTVGSVVRTRPITKPVDLTVLVAVDGTPTTASWTCDPITGIVLFTVPPAAGKVITAGCQFDVPVRFGEEVDDVLQAAIENYDDGSISAIPLVEIRDELELHNEFFYGGAQDFTITANMQLSVASGRVIRISSATPSLKCLLPDPTNLPDGGPYFYISANGAENVLIRDHSDTTTVATATAGGNALIVLLSTDLALNRIWWTL